MLVRIAAAADDALERQAGARLKLGQLLAELGYFIAQDRRQQVGFVFGLSGDGRCW